MSAPYSQEQLLDLLAAIAKKMEIITANGLVLGEGADEYEAEKLRSKIATHQAQVASLRQQLAKVRAYIKRQKELQRKARN